MVIFVARKKVVFENILLPASVSRVGGINFDLDFGKINFSVLGVFFMLKNFVFDKSFFASLFVSLAMLCSAFLFNWLFVFGFLFFGVLSFFLAFLNHRVASFLLSGPDGLF